jgi:23S rRNA pseudouridine1911/1915/1917 synthase
VVDSDDSETAGIELSAAEGAGQRLDRFLASSLPDYSRSRLQRWIALGAVSCDTRTLAADSRLTGHEHIVVIPQPLEADTAFTPEPVEFELIYEDDEMLVINKPAGLVVHPAPGNWSGTLLNGLLHRFESQSKLARAGIVHRLDKETSGLMMVARTEKARDALVAQLSARTVQRRYLAVCQGLLSGPLRTDGPIGRDRNHRLRMAVVGAGKPALTDITPQQMGRLNDKAVTLVTCQLHTGRTHQIRVHLAHAGFPLVGDTLYGGTACGSLTGQALHAFSLGVIHPVSGEHMQWIASPAEGFRQLLEQAGLNEPDYQEIIGGTESVEDHTRRDE